MGYRLRQRSRYSDWLRAGRPRGRGSSPGKVKNVYFSISSRPFWGPPSLLSNGYQGLFLREQNGLDVKLTTHLQLAPSFRKRRSTHPRPLKSSWRSAHLVKHRDNLTRRCIAWTGLLQVRRQPLLDFYLIQTCSRSTMKMIARARLPTPQRCALFALQKRGLAFNFSPPSLMEGRSTCIVCECPEFETLASLKKDLRYDYYSLYGNPLRKYHTVCPGSTQPLAEINTRRPSWG
jgi:hypothetical protein